MNSPKVQRFEISVAALLLSYSHLPIEEILITSPSYCQRHNARAGKAPPLNYHIEITTIFPYNLIICWEWGKIYEKAKNRIIVTVNLSVPLNGNDRVNNCVHG